MPSSRGSRTLIPYHKLNTHHVGISDCRFINFISTSTDLLQLVYHYVSCTCGSKAGTLPCNFSVVATRSMQCMSTSVASQIAIEEVISGK